VAKYYVRLSVVDKPGVIAQVSAILGRAKISIASLIQPEGHEGDVVPLILMMHAAPYSAMRRALRAIGQLPAVKAPPMMIRVEDFA
jgi:homoserine dehydrogenase